jgi:mRNA interferase MazF
MNDNFDKWNEVKKQIHQVSFNLGIKPREIYWTKIGLNIGNEEYGKGKDFVRPVIIVRQLTHDLFIGIPTTTSTKDDNDYFHKITYTEKMTNTIIESSAMILQQKVFSKKRLLSKIGTVKKEDFEKIVTKLKKLIDPT